MYYFIVYVVLFFLVFCGAKKNFEKSSDSFIEVANCNANKKNYLSNFLPSKLLHLFIVAGIACVFSVLVDLIFRKILTVNMGRVMPNWYIWGLSVGYILYYICYRFFNIKNKSVILFILTLTTTVIALILKLPRPYFISEWAFPIGALIYEYRVKISNFIKEKLGLLIIILLVIFFISMLSFVVKEYSVLDLILHNTLFLPFYFIILFLCFNFEFNNKVVNFFNKISFELYIYQFISMNIVTKIMQVNNINCGLLYILIVLGLDIIISMIMKKVNYFVLN